ncbi:hypothetical protein B0H14DRAFT_2654626 [Mycena olivaceomarginata]|nr:hypothetical protein B0H14DRAFT_2654626 [Mycena olivaceomarginata]
MNKNINPSYYREHTRQQDGWTVLAEPEFPPPYTAEAPPVALEAAAPVAPAANPTNPGIGASELCRLQGEMFRHRKFLAARLGSRTSTHVNVSSCQTAWATMNPEGGRGIALAIPSIATQNIFYRTDGYLKVCRNVGLLRPASDEGGDCSTNGLVSSRSKCSLRASGHGEESLVAAQAIHTCVASVADSVEKGASGAKADSPSNKVTPFVELSAISVLTM